MREYVATLVALLLGGVLLLVAYGATWAIVTVPALPGFTDDAGPVNDVVLSGRDIAAIGGAAGWIALARVARLLVAVTFAHASSSFGA